MNGPLHVNAIGDKGHGKIYSFYVKSGPKMIYETTFIIIIIIMCTLYIDDPFCHVAGTSY